MQREVKISRIELDSACALSSVITLWIGKVWKKFATPRRASGTDDEVQSLDSERVPVVIPCITPRAFGQKG
jgi:hypothetical protein